MKLIEKLRLQWAIQLENGGSFRISSARIVDDAQPNSLDKGQALFDAQGRRIEIDSSHGTILAPSLPSDHLPSVEPGSPSRLDLWRLGTTAQAGQSADFIIWTR